MEPYQPARHAQRCAEPGGGSVVAVVGAQAVIPDVHAARGRRLRIGPRQRQFQRRHAGEGQRQRVGVQGGGDQRHARKITLRHVAAVGIDHHPFAVDDFCIGSGQAGRGQQRLRQRQAGAGFDRVEDEFGQDGHGTHGKRRDQRAVSLAQLRIAILRY